MTTLINIVTLFSIFVGRTSFADSSNGERWAVLVAGKSAWGFYRYQASVCHAYQILKKGGLKEENIIVFMSDDIAYNDVNPRRGKIFNEKYGEDVYQGVPKDYTGRNVTTLNFYNALRGITNKVSNMKVLKSGPNDHILIYYIGLGIQNVLEMPRIGDPIHRDDFLSVLNYMHHQKLYKQMVVYVDANQSGSMFENATTLDDLNIFIITSTNSKEISYDCFWMEKWRTSLSTMYSAAWMKDINMHNLSETTLNQHYERVKKMVAENKQWGATVMKFGSERVGEKLVSEFFESA